MTYLGGYVFDPEELDRTIDKMLDQIQNEKHHEERLAYFFLGLIIGINIALLIDVVLI